MAKYKLQEMPDIHNNGKRRVYPKMVVNRQLNTQEFIEMMHAHNRALSESVVSAVLMDVSSFLGEMLSAGYTVKLDGLGSFSLALDFDDAKPVEMKDDSDKMTYRKVAVKDVNYKVSPELLKSLKYQTELERDTSGVNRLNKPEYTLEERINKAMELLDSRSFFTLQEYADINNMSRTTASRELKKLTTGEDAPFSYTGGGSHKVWVKKG